MSELQRVTDEASDLLKRIQGLFKPGAKVTLIVRNPTIQGDAGFMLTDDDFDWILEELTRRKRHQSA